MGLDEGGGTYFKHCQFPVPQDFFPFLFSEKISTINIIFGTYYTPSLDTVSFPLPALSFSLLSFAVLVKVQAPTKVMWFLCTF